MSLTEEDVGPQPQMETARFSQCFYCSGSGRHCFQFLFLTGKSGPHFKMESLTGSLTGSLCKRHANRLMWQYLQMETNLQSRPSSSKAIEACLKKKDLLCCCCCCYLANHIVTWIVIPIMAKASCHVRESLSLICDQQVERCYKRVRTWHWSITLMEVAMFSCIFQ